MLLLQWSMTMWIPESCKLPWRQSAFRGCTWQARSMAPPDMKRPLPKGWLLGLMRLPQVTALPVLLCTFSLLNFSVRCSVWLHVRSRSVHICAVRQSQYIHMWTSVHHNQPGTGVAVHIVDDFCHTSQELTLCHEKSNEVLLQRSH